jgi:hypothetical protein
MKKLNIIFIFKSVIALAFCLLIMCPAHSQTIYAGRYKAVFNAPPKEVPTTKVPDAPLAGNGDIGLTLGGKPDQLHFYFGKNDFWRAYPVYPGGGIALPGGLDIEIDALNGASYYAEQLFDKAAIKVKFNKGDLEISLDTWVSATSNTVVAEFTSNKTCDLKFNLWAAEGNTSETSKGRTGNVYWVTRSFENTPLLEWPSHVAIAMKVIGGAPSKENIITLPLINRKAKDVLFDTITGTAVISWNAASAGTIATEIKYNAAGEIRTVTVVPTTESTSLNAYTSGDIITYRTLFIPQPTAIDTFYTPYDSIVVNNTPDDESSYTSMVTLDADGPGNTYELIGKILGGSSSTFANESPDCSHPVGQQERHIWEEFDTQLNKYVFAFQLHVTPDGNLCTTVDRQRNEIKTFGPSPANVKAFNGDEMIFKWKFKLDAGFQPSSGFTHIHQIKAGDGTNAGAPLITITPRYGSPDKLEIIHTGNTGITTLGKVQIIDLAPFKGNWIEAVEKIKFGSNGTYSLILKKVSDGTILLSYSNDNIDMWRSEATFIRPKWGIYRSLNDVARLRDEKVLFADFAIGKK